MDRRRKPGLGSALGLCVVWGCSVAAPDLSRTADAGFEPLDGGEDCRQTPEICGTGQICGSRGLCVPRESCTPELQCVPSQVCVRDVSQARTSTGTCQPVPGGCTQDGDCLSGRCSIRSPGPPDVAPGTEFTLGLGRCLPAADGFGVEAGGRMRFHAQCDPSEEGPTCPADQACVDGVCGDCRQDGDCAAGRVCEAETGRCLEPSRCDQDDECFPGRICAPESGRCVDAPGCVTPSEVPTLGPGRWEGLSVCAQDVRSFALEVPPNQVHRVILETDPQLVLNVLVLLDDGSPVSIHPLRLPGTVAFDLPASPRSRRVRVEVTAVVGGGPFVAEIEVLPLPCARDPLDLLGRPLGGPRLEGTDVAFRLRACPGPRQDLRPVDRFRVRVPVDLRLDLAADFPVGGDPSNRLDLDVLGPDGQPLASTSVTDRPGRVQAALLPDNGPFPAEATAELRAELGPGFRVPPAGVDVDVVVADLSETRRLACEMGVPAARSREEFELAFEENPNTPVLGAPVCVGTSFEPNAAGRLFRIDWPDGPREVAARVVRVGGDQSELQAAFLTGCSDALAEVCGRSGLPDRPVDLRQRFEAPPAFLYVGSSAETDALTSVRLDVEVLAEPVPANDRCTDNTLLTTTSTTLFVSTLAATDTVSTSSTTCAVPGLALGPERFYRLEGLGGSRVQLTLQGPTGGVLWTASDCSSMEDSCLGLDAISPRTPRVEQVVSGLDTLFVAVDGLAADSVGRYELRIEVDPECTRDTQGTDCSGQLLCDENRCEFPGVEDRCPGRTVDLVSQSEVLLEGSLAIATDSLDARCGAVGSPESIFRVELPSNAQRLVARVESAAFDAALALRPSGCALSSGQACEQNAIPGEDNRPVISRAVEGQSEVWLVVESEAGTGPFRLRLRRE